MKRTSEVTTHKDAESRRKPAPKHGRGKTKKPYSRRNAGERKPTSEEKLDETRSNNPAWYFLDEKLADQVSQLSFQNLAGYPIHYDGKDFDVPNIVRIGLSPAPGVQTSATYGTALAQNSAINMTGFRLYSKLSAQTGRVQSYGPQDVSTMVLAMGELISTIEFIRRAFGVAYTMSMRNRDYPRNVLEFGMLINATDLFQNLSDYRTQFNTLITLVNQLPIPKNVAYFDKCAALYEKIYLDSPSSMAQTLVPVPFTTWLLDEQSYAGGSILSSVPVTSNLSFRGWSTPQNMSVYLNILASLIGALLNSSTLTVVYTDLLNYAAKGGVEFWRFDYLFEDYQVIPTYDENFLLQMHNATICDFPSEVSTLQTSPDVITPFNDVYPNAATNSLYYNPAFGCLGSTTLPRSGNDVLIDMLTDQVSVTDRVEVTRYASITKGKLVVTSGTNCMIDATLPDHYINAVFFESQTANLRQHGIASTLVTTTNFPDVSSQIANIDWAPRLWEVDLSSGTYTGRYTGDVNFYTTVDEHYLRKLHDFVGLALYDLR